jgi:tetratricopeptide (TPR) repeat protein
LHEILYQKVKRSELRLALDHSDYSATVLPKFDQGVEDDYKEQIRWLLDVCSRHEHILKLVVSILNRVEVPALRDWAIANWKDLLEHEAEPKPSLPAVGSARRSIPQPPREEATQPCNLPYRPLRELFIGRGAFLTDLRQRFETARKQYPNIWPHHVITGMGGVGKTRLAVEYAWQHKNDYTALLFVSGETPTILDSHLANLAGVLELGLPEDARDPDKRAAVTRWLKSHPGWLLIVDNIDNQAARDAVSAYLKDWYTGHVLITGWFIHWSMDIERLGLDILTPADASDFLLRSTPDRRAQPDDPTEAGKLAAELGGLCLALEQCSAYVNRLAISLAEYRHRWQGNVENVHAWADKVLMKYREEKAVSLSVATTWQTTFDQLSKPARELLQVLSWFAPEPLPQSLPNTLATQQDSILSMILSVILPPSVRTFFGRGATVRETEQEQAAAELRSCSLLKRSSDLAVWGEMHRVVQLITREQLSGREKKRSLARALAAMNSLFEVEPADARTWPVLNPLAAHAGQVVHHADAAGITTAASQLMNQLGLFLKEQHRFTQAEALFRRALQIDEQTFGENDAMVAVGLNNLATLLQETNRLVEAEELLRRALAIDERVLGKNHPTVAIRLHNLAWLLKITNRPGEAMSIMRQALSMFEISCGPDHANVAAALNTLGLLLEDSNHPAEAEPLMRRALEIDEHTFGKDHPRVALRLNNLAQVLQTMNRLDEAEPLTRRHVAILLEFSRRTGHEHVHLRPALDNYRIVLRAQGRSETEIQAELDRLLATPWSNPDAEIARGTGSA